MGYKKKTEKTLMSYTKKQLIEQIRILEHNWDCEKVITERQVDLLEKVWADK
jgi:hypothetical protein